MSSESISHPPVHTVASNDSRLGSALDLDIGNDHDHQEEEPREGETDHGQEDADIIKSEERIREEVIPYCPPKPNYIFVLTKEAKPIPVNNRCRKMIFVNYMKNMFGVEKDCEVDLCDLEGVFPGVLYLDSNDYVTQLFQELGTYVACSMTRDELGKLTAIEPFVTDWATKFPKLAVAIGKLVGRDSKDLPQEEGTEGSDRGGKGKKKLKSSSRNNLSNK